VGSNEVLKLGGILRFDMPNGKPDLLSTAPANHGLFYNDALGHIGQHDEELEDGPGG
jgi:hypothetical protein